MELWSHGPRVMPQHLQEWNIHGYRLMYFRNAMSDLRILMDTRNIINITRYEYSVTPYRLMYLAMPGQIYEHAWARVRIHHMQ
jgi:hypothetical protein